MAVHYWSVVYFFLLHSGNPDVEKSRSHAPRYDTYVPIVNRHFKTVLIFFVPVFLSRSGFVLSVLLLSSTPATVSPFRRELLLIFVFFIAKIRQVLTFLISPFASFRACCVVVEFHSSHSFAFPPWIVHFRVFIAKIWQVLTSLISPFALLRACCVVVEFHSSHSFANFAVFFSSFS